MQTNLVHAHTTHVHVTKTKSKSLYVENEVGKLLFAIEIVVALRKNGN